MSAVAMRDELARRARQAAGWKIIPRLMGSWQSAHEQLFSVVIRDHVNMQHAMPVRCVECGEPLPHSANDFGPWHSHCATLGLSSLASASPRGCPRCGELARRNTLGDESIADYHDRRWHLRCAADALDELVAARRRALLMVTARAPESLEHFADAVWARLVEDLCPTPGQGEHGSFVHPARFRHECHACADEDRGWLLERVLQVVGVHLRGAFRLLRRRQERHQPPTPSGKLPD